ncbi:host cell division inhibitor Icd-like protein [Enterobacteriaceae bacterium RIT711]|nr:host cell division inhibitor Icd-like protein [Enterobacteriaceae bacterium RIT711]
MNFDNFRLNNAAKQGYSFGVVTTVTAGRGNPEQYKATVDADCVFFIVVKSVPPYSAACARKESMVALAGQLSGWPVSLYAGISTPVSVTTNQERGNSGGDSVVKYKEIIIMMTTPVSSHLQYTWLFLAVRRSDLSDRPHREEVTACDYPTARRLIARDHIAAFAGRLPVQEVRHA